MPICRYKNPDGTKCKFGGGAEAVFEHEESVHGKRPGNSGRHNNFGGFIDLSSPVPDTSAGLERLERARQSRDTWPANPDRAAENREFRFRHSFGPQR